MSSRKLVGAPLNFRGFVYSPINEQGVVYLFGLVANDLNIRVESIQQGYPDCTAIRYIGKGKWERINIEFEYKSSSFDHDPEKCDVLVCWEDDLKEERRIPLRSLEIIELKSAIDTPEIPNISPSDPGERTGEEAEYDLEYHFQLRKSTQKTRDLFNALDEKIRNIDDSIWVKYAKTRITYYSPEKVFIFMRLRKSSIALTVFTDEKAIDGVKNIKDHENWGRLTIKNLEQLPSTMSALEKSYTQIKQAIEANKNTGWYALTPRPSLEGTLNDHV